LRAPAKGRGNLILKRDWLPCLPAGRGFRRNDNILSRDLSAIRLMTKPEGTGLFEIEIQFQNSVVMKNSLFKARISGEG